MHADAVRAAAHGKAAATSAALRVARLEDGLAAAAAAAAAAGGNLGSETDTEGLDRA